MSIKTSSGPTVKRRKLSHGSDDAPDANPGMNKYKSNKVEFDESSSDEVANKVPQVKSRKSASGGSKPHSMISTGSTTRASLLTLQINELLEEARLSASARLRALKPVFDVIVEAIKSCPENSPLPLSEAEKRLRKQRIAIPFAGHRPASDVKYSFAYRQPESIEVCEELMYDASVEGCDVEIAVQMPSSMFQEKDYLNHRALHKRAYYLACIAESLQGSLKGDFEFQYQLRNGNTLLPVISVTSSSAKGQGKTTKVCINVLLPPEVGPVEKLLPTKNSVRADSTGSSSGESTLHATPLYNSTVRQLASQGRAAELLRGAAQKCDAFRDACTLGKFWLQQRGMASLLSEGGFGSQEWALICALLLFGGGHKNQPLFSAKYSVIQLFKAMLQIISTRDLVDEPLLLNAGGLKLPTTNQPILYEGSMGVNILYNMSAWSYGALKQQAQISLTAANARNRDSFDSLFIIKAAQPALRYDESYSIRVPNLSIVPSDEQSVILHKVYDVLKRGLGDRASLINFRHAASAPWKLNKSGAEHSQSSSLLHVHLVTNSEAASRTIDNGPAAEEQEEAKDFRKFWGEKSELRRFRDGRITETLVWSTDSPVTLQIIQYLILHHFRILPSSLVRRSHDFATDFLSNSSPVSSTDAFKLINTKYQELSSKMHQLDGLPLPIRSVSPSDAVLRSASIGHPLDPSTACPINVLIQFDTSTRWPDHLPAIQHTKVAFLAKLADLLTENDSSISTRLGLENTESSTTGYLNTSFLDIIYQSAAPRLSAVVFRLRIHHDREIHLLQTALASKSLPSSTREPLSAALIEHKRVFVASPAHTAAIRNLITHFPSLSTTIRLFKSWIAHHNLSNHISEPVIEIISSHIFLNPAPWSAPGSATTAFLRCLHFLSHWDWTSTPIIVDLSLGQDMPASSYQDLETRFQAWKKLDPAMNNVAWFLGTNVDSTGTIWTQGATPPRVVGGRISALAKAAIELIKSKETSMEDADWRSLFISPLTDYDFVIHIKSSLVRGYKSSKSSKSEMTKFKNLQIQSDMDVDRIGHDVAALYMQDLDKSFGNAVLFFHGDGGKIIAGLWKPGTIGEKEWRVRLGWSSVPVATGEAVDGSEARCVINKNGMIAEMAMLGEGVVEKITLKE